MEQLGEDGKAQSPCESNREQCPLEEKKGGNYYLGLESAAADCCVAACEEAPGVIMGVTLHSQLGPPNAIIWSWCPHS